jgi:hypothetical protein
MPRIFDNIELDLLLALRATWRTWTFVPTGLLGDLEKPNLSRCTPRATAMAARRKVVSASMARRRTTPLGGLPNKLVPSPVGRLLP